jgi:RNA polymerase sigma-70 factor (ECF subfamily)
MGHADSINGGRDDDDIQDLLNTIPAPNTDLGHQASNWKTILHTLMKKLPKDQAQVVQLLYIEEKSVKDVSEMTGFSEPKVKISGFRGRQKLREMIQENTSLCDELRKIAENIE